MDFSRSASGAVIFNCDVTDGWYSWCISEVGWLRWDRLGGLGGLGAPVRAPGNDGGQRIAEAMHAYQRVTR